MKNVFLCLMLSAVCACGKAPMFGLMSIDNVSNTSQIINGRPDAVEQNYWKFTGMITGDGLCTGSLIGDDIFLTAAHCIGSGNYAVKFDDLQGKTDSISVIKTNCGISKKELFDNPLMTGSDFVSIEKVDEMKIWDICALKLARKPTAQFQPIELLKDVPADGSRLIHIGYGQRSDDGPSHERRVGFSQYTRTTAWTLESSQQADGTQVCFGDSGGPVVLAFESKLYLVGVLSAMFGGDSCSTSTQVQTKRALPFKYLWENL